MAVDDDLAADFKLMGAPVAAHLVRNEVEAFQVWPINWDSVTTFLACETQWNTASTMTAVISTGLNYLSLDVVMRRFKSPEHVFDDVLHMERVALKVFSEAVR